MKRKALSGNFLELRPMHTDNIGWHTDISGLVTLEIKNKGIFNFIAQTLFKKPKISYVHLDKTGSLIWSLIDGKKNIIELGKAAEHAFDKKPPLFYESLTEYFKILYDCKFILLNK